MVHGDLAKQHERDETAAGLQELVLPLQLAEIVHLSRLTKCGGEVIQKLRANALQSRGQDLSNGRGGEVACERLLVHTESRDRQNTVRVGVLRSHG